MEVIGQEKEGSGVICEDGLVTISFTLLYPPAMYIYPISKILKGTSDVGETMALVN